MARILSFLAICLIVQCDFIQSVFRTRSDLNRDDTIQSILDAQQTIMQSATPNQLNQLKDSWSFYS
jgi:hypothetical protein